jgi:hypothetical protein
LVTLVVTVPRALSIVSGPEVLGWDHGDAIYWASRNASLTSRAIIVKHSMHTLGGTDNRIHRADCDAARTPNAMDFIDDGYF